MRHKCINLNLICRPNLGKLPGLFKNKNLMSLFSIIFYYNLLCF